MLSDILGAWVEVEIVEIEVGVGISD